MNWQQLLVLGLVLVVAAIFVWRSSNPKKHHHDCGCGCHPEKESFPGEKKS